MLATCQPGRWAVLLPRGRYVPVRDSQAQSSAASLFWFKRTGAGFEIRLAALRQKRIVAPCQVKLKSKSA